MRTGVSGVNSPVGSVVAAWTPSDGAVGSSAPAPTLTRPTGPGGSVNAPPAPAGITTAASTVAHIAKNIDDRRVCPVITPPPDLDYVLGSKEPIKSPRLRVKWRLGDRTERGMPWRT